VIDPNCAQCVEWEICPFHAPDAEPDTERAVEAQSTPEPFVITMPGEVREVSCDISLRLIGPDDPEVSSDLIYATPSGGVVAVPRA
jgi:hypothetical protein